MTPFMIPIVASDGDFDLTKYLRRNCVDCGSQRCGGLRRIEIKHIREVLKAKVIIRIAKAAADQLVEGAV